MCVFVTVTLFDCRCAIPCYVKYRQFRKYALVWDVWALEGANRNASGQN